MDIVTAKQKLANQMEMMKFLASPRAWVIDQGLNPDDKEVAEAFEKVASAAFSGIANKVGAAGIANPTSVQALQGIGFGCCNTLQQ